MPRWTSPATTSCIPPPLPPTSQKQRKHGTSHLRCRARRAEARVSDEIAAAETYLKVVEDATIAQTREIAVQADLFPPPLETQDGPAEKFTIL